MTPRLFALLITLFCLGSGPAAAQISPLSDAYLLNPFLVNPAVAGTERYSPLSFNVRQQWMGWEGAPSMQAITWHKRIRSTGMFYTPQGFRNKGINSIGKVGIGGGFFNYGYGAVNHTGIHLDYAYHIVLDRGRLALGLAPLFFQYRLNKSGFVLPEPNMIDPLLSDPDETLFFLDANIGMHYYSENFYAGLSVLQLLSSRVKFGDYSFDKLDDRELNSDLFATVWGYAGYRFELSREIILEPSLYLRYNSKTNPGVHLNTLVHLYNQFRTGLSLRWGESLSMLAGVTLDNLEIIYQFEFPVTNAVPNRFSNHSIGIRMRLGEPVE